MTKKPVSNVGASVRQRLLNLRNQTGEDAQALFTQFAIERFLYRLSQSAVADMIRQIITTTVERMALVLKQPRYLPHDDGTLAHAIAETFARRGTPLPPSVITKLRADAPRS